VILLPMPAGSKLFPFSLLSLLHLLGGGDEGLFPVLHVGEGRASSLPDPEGGWVFQSDGGGLFR
jgi:hypothetical protein